MDVGDDIGLGKRENVAVVEKILFRVCEAVATSVAFFQAVSSDSRPHRSVEDENAFSEGGFEFVGKIVRHGLALQAEFWSDLVASQEQIYVSRYVDGFLVSVGGSVAKSGCQWSMKHSVWRISLILSSEVTW